MSISWEASYTGRLRQKVGHDKLIIPSTRALIRNDESHLLFIKRKGTENWGTPTGSQELDESVLDCLKREVKEETGLDVLEATLIAMYTQPRKSIRNRFGDEYQMFELLFRVDKWAGELVTETDESADAKFFPLDEIPPNEGFWQEHQLECIEDLKRFTGAVIVK